MSIFHFIKKPVNLFTIPQLKAVKRLIVVQTLAMELRTSKNIYVFSKQLKDFYFNIIRVEGNPHHTFLSACDEDVVEVDGMCCRTTTGDYAQVIGETIFDSIWIDRSLSLTLNHNKANGSLILFDTTNKYSFNALSENWTW